MGKEQSVSEFLKKGSFPERGFLILYGEEKLLHKKFLKKLREVRGDYQLYDGESLTADRFLELLGEKSLFSPSRGAVKVVRGAEKFFSKLRTAGKKRLLPFLSRKPSNLVVLLFETDLKKGETAKEPLKTLFATAEAVLKAPKPDKRQIAKLVANRFKAEGVVVEPAVVEYLTEQFADDLTALRTELEKLTTYATDTKRLTLSEVKELTFGNPKVSVFDFQDAFFGKNLKEALDTFRGLTANLTSYEKSAVVFQLLGLLLSTANRLLILKERAPSEGEDKVLRSLGVVYKFQAQKFKNWANLWSEKELKDLVRQLYLTDRALKVKFENPEESLKRLVVNAVGG